MYFYATLHCHLQIPKKNMTIPDSGSPELFFLKKVHIRDEKVARYMSKFKYSSQECRNIERYYIAISLHILEHLLHHHDSGPKE